MINQSETGFRSDPSVSADPNEKTYCTRAMSAMVVAGFPFARALKTVCSVGIYLLNYYFVVDSSYTRFVGRRYLEMVFVLFLTNNTFFCRII